MKKSSVFDESGTSVHHHISSFGTIYTTLNRLRLLHSFPPFLSLPLTLSFLLIFIYLYYFFVFWVNLQY